MAIAVSREAFYAACKEGDAAVLDAYFAQDAVRADVAETEAFVVSHRPTDSVFHRRGDGASVYPWYYTYEPPEVVLGREFLLGVAASRGHCDVLEWFFADERAPLMGATLAVALPAIAIQARDESVLEILLTSSVFRERVPDESKQELLDRMVWTTGNGAFTDLLVAHGASVNGVGDRDPLLFVSGQGTPALVDLFVENGSFVVGADVLEAAAYLGNVVTAHRLLECGADWGNGDGAPLHEAATEVRLPMVELLLREGFADVDARDGEGTTALMKVTAKAQRQLRTTGSPIAQIAQLLRDFGADATLKDRRGWTVLDHCVRQSTRR